LKIMAGFATMKPNPIISTTHAIIFIHRITVRANRILSIIS
jgi:hypothetical protein